LLQDATKDSGFEDLLSEQPKLTRNPTEEKDDYLYELVGVLVHSGSANSGHYYSYIKERHEDSQGRWLEFNDTTVRVFDIGALADKCYG